MSAGAQQVVGFFALCDIEPGQEITFDYGNGFDLDVCRLDKIKNRSLQLGVLPCSGPTRTAYQLCAKAPQIPVRGGTPVVHSGNAAVG